MPGSVTAPAVLKGHAAAIWKAAFLAAYGDTCKGEGDNDAKDACAAKVAWAAVKGKYRKAKGGAWVRREKPVDEPAITVDLVERKEFSDKRRAELAKSGKAMPGGEYPIENQHDLENAVSAFGRAKNPDAVKTHIKSRAKALGLEKLLPEDWGGAPEGSKEGEFETKSVVAAAPVQGSPSITGTMEDKVKGGGVAAGDREKLATQGNTQAVQYEEGKPILDEQGLKNALAALGRVKDRKAHIANITEAAKRLNLENLLPRPWGPEEARSMVERKEFSDPLREKLAKEGKAMPGGGYPIESEKDLHDAIKAIGRAKNRAATIRHIIKRAKALGLMKAIPEDWVAEVKSLAEVVRADPGEILIRRIAREQEGLNDVQITKRGLATAEAIRPAYIGSDVWRAMPPQERTYGSILRRRAVSREYHEAVDQMLENGWEARRNPNRSEEMIFRGYVQTPDGPTFVRSILVRRRGSMKWYPREVSRGVFASTSIRLAPDEVRYRGIEFTTLPVP
jgi:cation transport regulator ChaB